MTPNYILAPEALRDLVRIWRYIKKKSSVDAADRVERVILGKILFLARNPGAGHARLDLTSEPVKFFPVYSWLIVYRPATKPLEVVAVLHGRRDIGPLLWERM